MHRPTAAIAKPCRANPACARRREPRCRQAARISTHLMPDSKSTADASWKISPREGNFPEAYRIFSVAFDARSEDDGGMSYATV